MVFLFFKVTAPTEFYTSGHTLSLPDALPCFRARPLLCGSRGRQTQGSCGGRGSMSFNSFGHLFRVTTWGESHGPAIGAVVDGCPPGLALSEKDIQPWLDRSEARRVGKECVSTCRSRWSPDP